MTLEGRNIGFAMTGSFCTFAKALEQMRALAAAGARLFPILSERAYATDTRFFAAREVREQMEAISGREIWHTLAQVEPIGPKALLDLLVIAPCTGNTLGKLAYGLTDTPVVMAAKSQLRGGKPVLLAVSTNDALSMSAPSLARLLNARGVYFAPFGQDDPARKPASLVAHFELLPNAAEHALNGRQVQPMLVSY